MIAIILILIAIALPNFLEAQTRARYARASAGLRSIETAAMAHLTQYGFLYSDHNTPSFILFERATRQKNQSAICPNKNPPFPPDSDGGLIWPDDGGGARRDFYSDDIHCPLTTPIKFIDAAELMDPFSDGTVPFGMNSRENDSTNGPWLGKFYDTVAYNAFYSAGPDRVVRQWHIPYSPTNGTRSAGDLWVVVENIPTIARNIDGIPTLKTF